MRALIFMILMVCFYQVHAQQAIVYDSSAVALRNFPPARINEYKTDPEFQYERVPEPRRSLWNRFWDWFWGKVGAILTSEEGSRTFNIIFILLAIAVLVFFILKLTGMTNVGLFGKKNKGERLDHSVLEENIHDIDFDTAIQNAVGERNFRFAVRLLYLQSLKNLAGVGLINWQINKTNIAYVRELDGNAFEQPFRDLTLQFENNWYGDIPIEEDEFFEVQKQFNQFNRKFQ